MANTRQKALAEAQKAKSLPRGRPAKPKSRKKTSNTGKPGSSSTNTITVPPRARPAYRGANKANGVSDTMDLSEDTSLQAQVQVPQAQAQTPQAQVLALQVQTPSPQDVHLDVQLLATTPVANAEPQVLSGLEGAGNWEAVNGPTIDKVTDENGTWNGGAGFQDEASTWDDSYDGLENDSKVSEHSSDSDDEDATMRSSHQGTSKHNWTCYAAANPYLSIDRYRRH
jgi:hypothetical protein